MNGVVRMEWRHLLFASWSMEPHEVAPLLPPGLIVDTHDHKAWVTLVALRNEGMRPRGAPAFMGMDVPELNLRTYVTHDGDPGIYFFSLDASGLIAVLGARLAFQLPYFLAQVELAEEDDGLRFESRRRHPGAPGAVFRASYRPVGAGRAATRPLDRFLLERYRLYTKTPLGLARLDIEHPSWFVHDAEATITENTVLESAGLPGPKGEPVLHYGEGRSVVASLLSRV